MRAEIKFISSQYQFGRPVMMGQLFVEGQQNIQGSLAQILQFVKDKNLVLTNAQEVLDFVVRQSGFAS